MRTIKKDSTNESVTIRIIDSTTGVPELAVEHDTAGIDLWYRREGATKTSITEVALAALDTAHTDGGIEHVGDGYYRLDPPDAAFATGCNGVLFGGAVTEMVVIGCYVPLVDYDPQDTVRLGLTALPNAAANAAGGLPVSAAGGLAMDTLADWVNGERLDLLLDAIPTTAMRGTDDAALASVVGALNNVAAAGDPTDADTLVQYIKQLINVLVGTAGVGTYPVAAAPGNAVSLAEILRSIYDDTDELQTDDVPTTLATIAGYLDTEIAAIVDAVITNATGVDIAADIIAMKAETVLIVGDTNELQTDWANGGRLDLILDIIAADTTTDIPALIGTAQADLDIITAVDGTTLSAASIAAIWDATEAVTGQSHAYSFMIPWIFRRFFNKALVTDANGNIAWRNEADDGDIATGNVVDNAGTTTMTAITIL